MSVLVRTTGANADSNKVATAKRSYGVLSDGSRVMCILDPNQAGVTGDGGDGTGIPKFYIFHSPDGVTWTLKNTITATNTPGSTVGDALIYAFCVGKSNDNLHIAFRDTTGALRYYLLTYSAGPTWTPAAQSTVVAADAGDANGYRRLDMDLVSQATGTYTGDAVVIAAYFSDSSGSSGAWSLSLRLFVKRLDTGAWVQTTQTIGSTSNFQYPFYWDVTVAADLAGADGTSRQGVIMGVMANSLIYGLASPSSDDDRIFYAKVNADTGAVSNFSWTVTALNRGVGTYQHHYWVFSTANNEFTFMGLLGITAPKAWAQRVTVNPTTNVVTTTIASSLSSSRYDSGEPNDNGVRGWSRAASWSKDAGMIAYPYKGSEGSMLVTMVRMNRTNNSVSFTGGFEAPFLGDQQRVSGYGMRFIQGGNNRNLSLGTVGFTVEYASLLTPGTYTYQVHWHEIKKPNAPDTVVPANGATVTTDLVTVKANHHLPYSGPEYKTKMVWQLATNNTFTTGLRTVTEPDSDFILVFNTNPGGGGIYTATDAMSGGSALTQGVWYIRAAGIDEFGRQGPWSATQSFTVSHPPSAIANSPNAGSGAAQVWAATTTFYWTFSDPSPSDYQTAYQIVVERVDTGATVADSGKVISGSNTGTLAIGAGYKDIQLRWKIRVWDRDDVVSAYSATAMFMLGDPSTTVITSPADAGTVTTANPAVSFTHTVPGGSGRTLAQAWVILYKGDQVLWYKSLNSSELAALSVQIPSGYLTNTQNYSVMIWAVDSSGLDSSDLNAFATSWTPPAAPVFSVNAALHATNGYTRVTWTNSTIDGNFIAYRVYRRVQGTTAWTLLNEQTVNQSSYTFDDWLAGSNVTYEYTVVQVINYAGSVIESVPSATAATGGNTDYWLIHPTDNNKNMVLTQVADEGFEEEYEQASYMVIGRGRHVDFGQRLGYKGSLGAQFRDTSASTARAKRQALEALRAEVTYLYLRNPFGDVFKVAPGNIGISRLAGLGQQEAVDVTIPYEEVAF